MPRSGVLTSLFAHHLTDKNNHNFAPLYEKHLPEKIDTFMEIGVFRGGGILAFRDWYLTQGNFYGLNIQFGSNGVPSRGWFNAQGVETFEGAQQDIEFLSGIDVQFDVIVEDASHRSDDQIITFKHLFKNNVKPGGLYILEDLHCCKEDWWWGQVKSFEDTFLGVATKVLEGKDWTSQMFSPEDNDYLKGAVSDLILINPPIMPPDSEGGGIAFMWKS